MSRRRVAPRSSGLLAAGLVATIVVAVPGSSSPASAADDAASVNGESISVEDFDAATEELGVAGLTPAVDDAMVSADAGRLVLSVMIRNSLSGQLLAERDQPLTEEELAAQIDAASQQHPTLTGVGRDVLATDVAYRQRFAQLEAPTEDELAGVYDESPAGVGVMCLNVISIVGNADQAADALRDGAPASDVVADAGNGSRVQDECLSLGELGLNVPGLFHDLIELRPGELLDPIETPTGHQILQVAAFGDIASELVAYFTAPPVSPGTGQPQTVGDLLLMGYSVTADIGVNPRYGRWDAATVSIVPLGRP